MGAASKSCARSNKRYHRPIPPHPTPPHWCSIKVLCKVGWTLASHPPPHPTPWHRHLVQGRGNVAEGTLTSLPHVSVASTSCAWSGEHGRGNINIPTPLYSTPPHPTPCKLRGKWWALRRIITYIIVYIYIHIYHSFVRVSPFNNFNCMCNKWGCGPVSPFQPLVSHRHIVPHFDALSDARIFTLEVLGLVPPGKSKKH